MNIILIDEMTISDVKEDGENAKKSDWSKIDVSQPNSFLLVAFNPVGRYGYFRLLCTLGNFMKQNSQYEESGREVESHVIPTTFLILILLI